MSRSRLLPLLLVAAMLGVSGGFSQEKKEPPKDTKDVKDTKDTKDAKKEMKEKEPTGKLKGFLPPNWAKIGLSDDQKQNVYKVQSQYRDEIDKLQAKIDDLKSQQKKDLEKILTDEQKKRLRELKLGEKEDK